MLRGEHAIAESLVSRALLEHPHSFELRRIFAGIHSQIRRDSMTESLLMELHAEARRIPARHSRWHAF